MTTRPPPCPIVAVPIAVPSEGLSLRSPLRTANRWLVLTEVTANLLPQSNGQVQHHQHFKR